jgi:hypothetical protein
LLVGNPAVAVSTTGANHEQVRKEVHEPNP